MSSHPQPVSSPVRQRKTSNYLNPPRSRSRECEQVPSPLSLNPTTESSPVAQSITGRQKVKFQGLTHIHDEAMAKGGGLALKGLSLFMYFIEFCCAAIILGIFSYFLAALVSNNLHVDTYIRAVEGISGAAVLYTIFALLLVCCLGGILVASLIAVLFNLAFCGAFIYLAYATRHGASSCSGIVNTPLGTGNVANGNRVTTPDDGIVYLPSYRTACKLNTACFAVAVVGAVFFFLSTLIELALMRHHRKEKAFGPSPNNGYTAGSPRRKFWQRKPKTVAHHDAEKPDALPAHTTPAAVRNSYNTESTAVGNEPAYNKYGNNTVVPPATYGNTAVPATATGGLAAEAAHHPVHPSPYGAQGHFGQDVHEDFVRNGQQTTTTTTMPAANYNRGGNF
ncbi:hypothetical protein GLAREA_01110 [Glarea lozoyensis ATCC 20868]|uniref:MARVEL domain-containing protein n=1 Tax=Glarea lozoyensis (strain ATCC 20868 / MF5171) TaxID=1116229 RepID=S3CWD6_GLAL2|nr:uncharacterized protein GLAREA_01110 [Glarea lozoyensis ATCC 20868]EPE29950.1 hypothetical protein GLAREA_01110 [Glarea lozoyensis ATCC 20868]